MKEFANELLRQLFGWEKPREGKLVLTYYASRKMAENGLDTDTLRDVYKYGEEVNKNMIVRKYQTYTVGIMVKPDYSDYRRRGYKQYLILTCWKRANW